MTAGPSRYPAGYATKAIELYEQEPSLSHVHKQLCELYQAAHEEEWEEAQRNGAEWLGPHPMTVWRWIMNADAESQGELLARSKRWRSHLLGEVFSDLAGEMAIKARNARTSGDARNFSVAAGIGAQQYQDLVGGGGIADPPRGARRSRGRPDGGIAAGNGD